VSGRVWVGLGLRQWLRWEGDLYGGAGGGGGWGRVMLCVPGADLEEASHACWGKGTVRLDCSNSERQAHH